MISMLSEIMRMADAYAHAYAYAYVYSDAYAYADADAHDSCHEATAARNALRDSLRDSLPQQDTHRVAITSKQLDELHQKLGGKPERPTYNPSKVQPDWSAE